LDDKPDADPVLGPLALIAPSIAFVVTVPLLFVYAAIPAGMALVGAVAVGAPVLSMAHKMGLRGLIVTTILGGAAPAAAVYLVGLLLPLIFHGQVRLNGPDAFLLAIAIGAATGATYATIYDSVDLTPPQVRWRIMTIVLLAVMSPWVAMIARRLG
jgi:hypothetical protein